MDASRVQLLQRTCTIVPARSKLRRVALLSNLLQPRLGRDFSSLYNFGSGDGSRALDTHEIELGLGRPRSVEVKGGSPCAVQKMLARYVSKTPPFGYTSTVLWDQARPMLTRITRQDTCPIFPISIGYFCRKYPFFCNLPFTRTVFMFGFIGLPRTCIVRSPTGAFSNKPQQGQ